MRSTKKNEDYSSPPTLSNTPPHGSTLLYDVLILGAGAAGLMCARTASARGCRVALIDHNAQPGRKIAVSGGGKANFTNLHMNSEHFVGQDPSFAEPALEAFTPQAIMDILRYHGLTWEEREHGQLFGLAGAESLVEALTSDCRRQGCHFYLGHSVHSLAHDGHTFSLALEGHSPKHLQAASVVLALGAPAWPQVGATDAGLSLAKQWGHKSTPFRPVLTALRMPNDWALQGLAGISLKAEIHCASYTRHDDVLFTHQGLSGPAVLQLSCRWQAGQQVNMNFLPNTDFAQLLDAAENGKLLVRTLLCRHIPQRLADALLPPELAKRKVAELSRAARNALRDAVHCHSVSPTGRGDMRHAEAAAGGVLTKQVNAWSMESLERPGLFLVGELLDITGHLGGYNLHWAWASGHMAGQHIPLQLSI